MSWDNYFDSYGLLTMENGDGGDSAQKTGLYRFGQYLANKNDSDFINRISARFNQECDMLTYVELVKDKSSTIIKEVAHPHVYVRHPKPRHSSLAWQANPRCFSRDQHRSLVVAMGALKLKDKLKGIFWKHITRFGLYQNDRQLDGVTPKIPDVPAPGILGEYIRAFYMAGYKWVAIFYPYLLFSDLTELVVGLPSHLSKAKNPDFADDDNFILTLLQAKVALPTPISWLMRKLYKKHRPVAGYIDETKTINLRAITDLTGPESAVAWKHRSSVGAPPFAQLYSPILKEHL